MAAIDRNSAIPLYYQLKLYFTERIEKGELRPGDQLPTEMELCEQLGVSRAPVRQAMTELVQEGLIYRRAGQGSFVAPRSAAAVAERSHLRVLAHYDVRWLASLEQAVRTWNGLHPEHQVQLDTEMCAREEFHDALRRATLRGEAPDLASMDFVWLTHYASEGYLARIDELDSRWAAQLAVDLEPPVLRNNTVDGHLYGVPAQSDVSGLWYRKDWFDEEGLAPPETWEQWLTILDHFASPVVKRRFGHHYAVVLPVTAMTGEATVHLLLPFIWMTGGEIVDSQGGLVLKAHLEQVAEALRFLQEITLQRRTYLPVDVYRSRWWHLARFFAQGDVPMTLGGTYEWPRIREESAWDTEEDAASALGFVMLPRTAADTPPIASLGGTSWVIFEQSAHKDLTLEVLKLVASTELSTAFCEENLQISPYVSVNQRLQSPEHPWLSSLVPLMAHARNRPMLPNYLRVSTFLREMLENVLWEGAQPEPEIERTAMLLSVVMALTR